MFFSRRAGGTLAHHRRPFNRGCRGLGYHKSGTNEPYKKYNTRPRRFSLFFSVFFFCFVSITDQRGTRQQRPASYASLPLCSASASSARGTLGLKVTASSRAGLDLSADSLIIVANRVSVQFQLVLEVPPFIVVAARFPLARQCLWETSKFANFSRI